MSTLHLELMRENPLSEIPSPLLDEDTVSYDSSVICEYLDQTLSIGHIAIGCALSYLDFRFAAEDWPNAHPQIAAWHATFAGRASARATDPVDDS
jgi:glutathione S-transferase